MQQVHRRIVGTVNSCPKKVSPVTLVDFQANAHLVVVVCRQPLLRSKRLCLRATSV